MAREKLVDDGLVNVLLGAAAAIVGVTLAGGVFGFVMDLIHDDQGSLLDAAGFGLLAGIGMGPVSMLFGGAAAHSIRDRAMTVGLLLALAAIGGVATFAFGAFFGMFVSDGPSVVLAIASVFGGLGAAMPAWLYDLTRRRRVWISWMARLA